MKVFLDANVIIDVVLNRTEYIDVSSKILQLGLDGQCELCASDITFTTVSFYARKHRTAEQLYEVLQTLRSFIDVAPSGKIAIDWALRQKAKDFEDAVQYYSALRSGAEFRRNRQTLWEEGRSALTQNCYQTIHEKRYVSDSFHLCTKAFYL